MSTWNRNAWLPYRPRSAGKPVTCERCGEPGLKWGNDGRGWYLIDENADPHECGSADVSEFDVVE